MSTNCIDTYWSDSYLLGDSVIDTEHKKLFSLSKQLSKSQTKEEVFHSLKELIKYTKFHFAHEEKFMQSINFPYLQEHKVLHKDIVQNLNGYIEKKQKTDFLLFAKELSLFVNESIVAHILTEDKRVHHYNKKTELLKKIFQWKDTYKIEHNQIDNEHEKLFQLAIKALKIPDKNKKQHIRTVLIELTNYMKEHFTNEEQYMSSIEFPDLKRHKELHNKIIIQMNDFIRSLSQLTIEQFERKLIEYMDVWLINHIIAEDHKIVCFTKNKESQNK